MILQKNRTSKTGVCEGVNVYPTERFISNLLIRFWRLTSPEMGT